MNCKNCGKELVEGANCDKCDKDLARFKKNLKYTGDSVFALGVLGVAFNTVFIILGFLKIKNDFLDKFIGDYSVMFLFLAYSVVCIILGNRIKKINDKNIPTYLTVLFTFSVILTIFVILLGGKPGVITIIILCYLAYSMSTIKKFLKNDAFTSTLIEPEYKVRKKHWIFIGVGAFIIFLALLAFDIYAFNKDEMAGQTDSANMAQVPADTSKAEIAQEIVTQMKAEIGNLPRQIDEVTFLDNINALEGSIIIEYSLVNVNPENVNSETVKKFVVQSTCESPELKNILKEDVVLQYQYTVKENGKTYIEVVERKDCGV